MQENMTCFCRSFGGNEI